MSLVYNSNKFQNAVPQSLPFGEVRRGYLYTPFGELMYEHNPGWENGRIPKYAFNAKELDEENGMYYYSARYYAPPTFISRDPMFEKYPSISPYTYCANNPVGYVDPTGKTIEEGDPSVHIDKKGNVIAQYDDNDNSVYVHKTGTTEEQVDQQRTQNNNTGGTGKKIGELGGTINTSGIMENKLSQSAEEAKSMNIKDYYFAVKTNGKWDLKNNKNTIWGVAWKFDEENKTNTNFTFSTYSNMSAADVGNYHAGYTGKFLYGGHGLPDGILLDGAGFAEIAKCLSRGQYKEGVMRAFISLMPPPFNTTRGDRYVDYLWNKQGMSDARR